MEPVRVRDCTMGPKCHAPIFYLRTVNNARMPIDAATVRCASCQHPHDEGKGILNLASRCTVANPETGAQCPCSAFFHQPIYNAAFHVSHFRTCPYADQARRKRPRG